MSLEVIIPAFEPDEKLDKLVDRLTKQTMKPDRIRVLLTTSKPDEVLELKRRLNNNALVEFVLPEDFSHGGTRQRGMDESDADYVLMMTQDAVPVDRELTQRLYEALQSDGAAAAYARHLPLKDADPVEKFSRHFNYPKISSVQSAADLKTKGIRAVFMSDTCCMYRHDIFNELGGFERYTDFNEDSIFAYNAIMAGYSIIYCAEARVFHSHSLSLKEQFKRNRAIARCQKEHSDIYGNLGSEHEGLRYFKEGALYFFKHGEPLNIVRLFLSCGFRYAGYFCGKHF